MFKQATRQYKSNLALQPAKVRLMCIDNAWEVYWISPDENLASRITLLRTDDPVEATQTLITESLLCHCKQFPPMAYTPTKQKGDPSP